MVEQVSNKIFAKLIKWIFGVEVKDPSTTLKDITKVIVETVVIVVTIQSLLVQPFHIPSGSMVPNLLIGDYLFVSKFNYGYSKYSLPFNPPIFEGRIFHSDPKCGDVIVFYPPHENQYWVKRVVGLPGDRIQMIEGYLYINGEKMPLEAAGEYQWKDERGRDYYSKIFTQKLHNGVEHKILKTYPFGQSRYDNTAEVIVPEGHYFVMGDNRDHSGDSRSDRVGLLHEDYLVGKAQMIFFSTDLPTTHGAFWQVWRWPMATRYARFFNLIN